MKLLRSLGAVLAGMITWAILWATTNAAIAAAMPEAFNEDGSTDHSGILLGILLASVIFSVLAGWITALVSGRKVIQHTVALGIVQLAIGIAVQVQYWQVMPLWYHLPFLALLIPGNVFGGMLRQGSGSPAVETAAA